MLARKNRVPRALFPYVLAKGRTYNAEHVYARVASIPTELNGRQHQSRFSFVVSIKVAKKAVDRRALRRAGYDVIEKERAHLKDGFIVVFFFSKAAKEISKEILQHEIEDILRKTSLYV